MPERIRFHLDENVDPAIAQALRRTGIDVTTSQEANLLSRSDLAQLSFAKSKSRVLVTHDDDFLILTSQGYEHCGVVYCQKDTKPLGYLIRMLILLQEVATPEELKNRVEYL
jgi:predicted nuclease of predicted toxin-antitoxin system